MIQLSFERSFVQYGLMYLRSQTTSLDDLSNRLERVFVEHGYDGASIASLATSAGLSKASLYHHFPGGKQEMASVLLQHAIESADHLAFGALRTQGPAFERLNAFLDGYQRYTRNGSRPCLLAVFGQAAPEPLRETIKEQFQTWQIALESSLIGLRSVKSKRAARLAEETLCGLYGASLLAQLTGDHTCVERCARRLRKLFELNN